MQMKNCGWNSGVKAINEEITNQRKQKQQDNRKNGKKIWNSREV